MTQSAKFEFFTGKLNPGDKPLPNPLKGLPAPPPWRQFAKTAHRELDPAFIRPWNPTVREQDIAEAYRIGSQTKIIAAVNAALILRRPLLVTGPAGAGKSSLINSIARELQLGPILTWNITSRSTLREGLYDYDAFGRLQEIQGQVAKTAETLTVERFMKLGPLGTAFVATRWPRALLIDEIDKADLDLPNDLLNLFEEGRFTIEELRRDSASAHVSVRCWKDLYDPAEVTGGHVTCEVFPFVLLTSNGEREFSAPFLRRCIQLEIGPPSEAQDLAEIVKAHMIGTGVDVEAEAEEFLAKRAEHKLSTDQLLNAIFVLERCKFDDDVSKQLLLNSLYRPVA